MHNSQLAMDNGQLWNVVLESQRKERLEEK